METMSKAHPKILDILFPAVRAKLLRLLFTSPAQQRYVRELALMSGLNIHTVHDELRKLSAIGLIISWSNGYHRFYQPKRDHPIYPDLSHIVRVGETFPRIKRSTVRPAHRGVAKRSRRYKPPPLPKDWPIKWHLFSPPDHSGASLRAEITSTRSIRPIGNLMV
jgi:hypothetical protein